MFCTSSLYNPAYITLMLLTVLVCKFVLLLVATVLQNVLLFQYFGS